MRIALFGGSFDPIHTEHIALAVAAKEELDLDKLVFIPSYRAPHKAAGAAADGEARLAMCRMAAAGLPFSEVSDLEIAAKGTSYTYLTCRAFRDKYPAAELFFLVGADMLEDFFTWREPDDILKNVTLVACGRGETGVCALHERFIARFRRDFTELKFCGKSVSSTDLRVMLAFGDGEAERLCGGEIYRYIRGNGLYRLPDAEGALDLLTDERRAHTERVALLACRRARSLFIAESKALTAAMLHDCGKYVPLTSPLLCGFTPPEGVPAPVMHQYAGAYLAEHVFSVSDGDVLNAIRYHTSGRAGMSVLEILIFLSDLLEEGRSFDGAEALRKLFFEDLGACLRASLSHQLAYLKARNMPVYPLTEEALKWAETQYVLHFKDKNG